MGSVKKAETLDDIRRVCRPMPLKGEELDVFFVETDLARDPNMHTRQRLVGALDTREDVRLLFYGHRGCGKSTELNKLLAEQGERFFPVTFSILDEMNSVAVRAEDLILVITERVLSRAREAGLNVSEAQLKPVLDYFSETVITSKTGKDSRLSVGAGASSKSGLLGQLLGVFVNLSGEIRLNAHSDETSVARLRKRPADLISQANCVIEAVRDSLPEDKRLLIVVEDLDKLDLKQAHEIYVNKTSLLTGINTNIIYTIPVFLFHSPDANAFRHHFDDIVPLPMIKVTEPPENPVAGFDTVRQIILQRFKNGLIEDSALDILVKKTGGVLRHAFEVIHTAALMANARIPLGEAHIQYGLNQLRREFWQQITLPYEGLPDGTDSVDALYDRLEIYGRKQQQGEKTLPKSDSVNQLLLKTCALVEYNGMGWFGVHPLVMENLRDLGRLS